MEEDIKEEDKVEPPVEGLPPLANPAIAPELSPDPSPLLRFLPDTEKGDVEACLLAEPCRLSGV